MKKQLITITGIAISLAILFFSCKKNEKEIITTSTSTTENSLLSNPQKGQPVKPGGINHFTLASNEKDVALIIIAKNYENKLYAVDLQDNDPGQAANNAINFPNASIILNIAQQMGVDTSALLEKKMEINPISKSLYLLVSTSQNLTSSALFKVTNGGKTVTLVDLSNVSFSDITLANGNNYQVNDWTWGNNTLYISLNDFTLGGELIKIPSPFINNYITPQGKSTILYSTHEQRFTTDAPLEQIAFGKVNGENRLMGVTTCAPGYSFKVSDLDVSESLQINQSFDLVGGMSSNLFVVTSSSGKTYLLNQHNGTSIYRIGQKYLDGSQANINANAKQFRSSYYPFAITSGLTDEDIKNYPGTYWLMAKYSDDQFLVLTNKGVFTLLDI